MAPNRDEVYVGAGKKYVLATRSEDVLKPARYVNVQEDRSLIGATEREIQSPSGKRKKKTVHVHQTQQSSDKKRRSLWYIVSVITANHALGATMGGSGVGGRSQKHVINGGP